MAASGRNPGTRFVPILAALAAAILVTPSARAAKPAESIDLTPAQWHADVKAFASELEKRHIKPFHFVSREVLESEVARLDSAIAGLDSDAIVVRLMRLTAMIGDGHTGLHLPAAFRSYPIGLHRFGAEFRVIRTAGGADSALGTTLVAIDDTPVATVAAMVDSILSQDELPGLRDAEGPGFMSLAGILHGLGVTKDPGQARFTFRSDDGTQRILTLSPLTAAAKDTKWQVTSKEIPLYRKRADALTYTWLPESRTVYCNFRNYESLGSHAKEMFEFVDQHPVDRLVIDMRLNGGGDFYVGRHRMIEPVLKRPAINQEGHLFVLVGPLTFSAALANAIDFRTKTKAMLVGEPIGEKPNSYSENDEFRLPNSHLTVSYSTRYYSFAPGQDVITPDRVIAPTWEEFRDGRDPVLEWVLGCCR